MIGWQSNDHDDKDTDDDDDNVDDNVDIIIAVNPDMTLINGTQKEESLVAWVQIVPNM